jgi:SAM-dependent methyltransferase
VRRPYLGTDHDPQAYYEKCADSYDNPHAPGIKRMLLEFVPEIVGRVLDYGCGNGLATRTLQGLVTGPFVGVDRETRMVGRYRLETGQMAHVRNFWDSLPESETAIASYSLHLCPHSLLHLMASRLIEAGVRRLIVISPLKRPSVIPCFRLVTEKRRPFASGKTMYGRLLIPTYD